MKIKDIVNSSVATITTCESEPIHIPGSIQPHGALLALDKDNIIKFCSANSVEFFLKKPVELLNQPLPTVLEWVFTPLQADLAKGVFTGKPITVKNTDKVFEILLQKTGEFTILEIEISAAAAADTYEIFTQTTHFISAIGKAGSLQELCGAIADETRNITGYDRVLVYRFDKEYNGEVFAESKRDDLEPLLGLHYPHTDIPAQARALYLKNLMRLISNVHYTPVPLMTMDDGTDKQLDLSDATLRSVSPIHIQYLKNMGVGGTLTLSILCGDVLWGLITCHHSTARKLSFLQRQKALLQAHFLSSQIRVQEVSEEYKVTLQVERDLQQLLNTIEQDEDFTLKFEHFDTLLSVTNATGAVILYNGALYEKGLVPSPEKTLALIRWLAINIKPIQLATSELVKRYPEGVDISRYASGIIYHSLGKANENCIIWFREELEKTVNWAGNPNNAVKTDPVTHSLTPRASFEIWQERVRNQSRSWHVSEINAAMRFATTLQHNFHLQHLQQEEYGQRILNEKLLRANNEVANINWITSHDLKEPLRKIVIFASRILKKEELELSELIRNSVVKIEDSARRMQLLVDDIVTYSTISDKQNSFVLIDLNTILYEVQQDLSQELKATNGELQSEGLPTIKVIPQQVKQLFYNLILNSIKFSKEGIPPKIKVTCSQVTSKEIEENFLKKEQVYYKITVLDNGLGFPLEYSKKIFDIFYRLDTSESNNGTGIGLAICKKIIDNHQGAITCRSEVNKGSAFSFYLPAIA